MHLILLVLATVLFGLAAFLPPTVTPAISDWRLRLVAFGLMALTLSMYFPQGGVAVR